MQRRGIKTSEHTRKGILSRAVGRRPEAAAAPPGLKQQTLAGKMPRGTRTAPLRWAHQEVSSSRSSNLAELASLRAADGRHAAGGETGGRTSSHTAAHARNLPQSCRKGTARECCGCGGTRALRFARELFCFKRIGMHKVLPSPAGVRES